jgi:lysophospholipase L1-like esterase
MYELASGAHIVPIPVTVPSIRTDVTGGAPDAEAWSGQHAGRLAELNGLISEFALSKNLPWIDLFTATAESNTNQLAAQYSNDGVHLTTAGYRLFGHLLYTRVFAKSFRTIQGTES